MDKRKRRKALKRIGRYGQELQALLRLDHWQIDIDPDLPEGAKADVNWYESKWRATMRFSDEILRGTPEEQRYTVVHELLHLHLRGPALIIKQLRGHMSDVGYSYTDERWEHEEELAVDALAQAIAPFLPLSGEHKGGD